MSDHGYRNAFVPSQGPKVPRCWSPRTIVAIDLGCQNGRVTTLLLLAGFLTAWLLTGLIAGIWIVRRGHDKTWIAIAAVLGPLFVPIAAERVEHGSRLANPGSQEPPPPRDAQPSGVRLLVGLDGSPAAQRVLDTAVSLFGRQSEMIMLARVVYYEASEFPHHRALGEATEELANSAALLRRQGIPCYTEILTGPPAATLGHFAESYNVDAVVIGRQGRGLTKRLLGSVATELTEHCAVPIIILAPGRGEPTPVPRDHHLQE
ncbi:universal stress protein [Mycobacterium syngnathidarum]